MKNILVTLLTLFTLSLNSPAFALDGQGIIKETRVCGTGIADPGWANYLVFRLSDGNWFGVYGNYVPNSSVALDDSIAQSLVLLAHANNQLVKVRATYSIKNTCGVSVNMVWNKLGDYISVIK